MILFTYLKIILLHLKMVCIRLQIKKSAYFTIQLILLFNLFLLLFMASTAFFIIIHMSHFTILINFYLYLQYFQQKNFSFSKISRSQTDSRVYFMGFASWNFVVVFVFFFFFFASQCVQIKRKIEGQTHCNSGCEACLL